MAAFQRGTATRQSSSAVFWAPRAIRGRADTAVGVAKTHVGTPGTLSVVDRTLTFTTPPSPCEYLPERVWQLHYEADLDLSPTDYMARLRSGWRRFGFATF